MKEVRVQTPVSAQRMKGLILSILMIVSSQMALIDVNEPVILQENQEILRETSERTSQLADVPNWRIGDRWNYDGYLDVRDFVAGSGVSTNVEFLDGTLDSRVTDIYTMEVEDVSTLVYKVESEGDYQANNVDLSGYTGDLIIEIDTIEIIRASDLASIEQEATIDIDFDYQIFWWTYTIHVAELVVTNEYSPSLENYDFPIAVGEEWETSYSQETTYSGTSDYVDIPDDTSTTNTTSWEVVARGNSGVSYGGCGQSYNITTYNSNGDETGYRWYCPAISNDIKSETTESIGFIAVHELNYYQASTRSRNLDVDIEFQLSPLNVDMDATITVTDNSGNAVTDQEIEFRFEIEEDIRTGTTDANGQITFNFNSGEKPDSSEGGTEMGSHGVIARIVSANQLGASTIITDSSVHPVDLIANSAGVTVERTRDNNTISLNSIIGFTAIPNDVLTFSVPVQNKGVLTSPATEIRVTGPDGASSTRPVSSLPPLGIERVEIDWVVPSWQSIGDTSVTFVVDENEEITNDGNRSNNYGSFTLFIGRLPSAVLDVQEQTLTLNSVSMSGLNSFDLDGGTLDCTFEIETVSGATMVFEEESCTLEYTWDDDGEYQISLTVTDEESDSDTVQSSIIVNNRPPELTVEAESESIPIESSITFEVTERSDADSNNPFSPVDVAWQTACEEGSSVSARCTVTPSTEGEYTIEVIGMDDDGATTSVEITVDVTNIAPSNPSVQLWIGNNKLTPNSYGKYSALEGDEVRIIGWAEDSDNDIEQLTHLWTPDADENGNPEITQSSVGAESTITYTYTTSGIHLATLVVTDDDGESTETLTVPIEILNVVPMINPIAPPLPVAEDGEIQITASVWDTSSDLESLQNCYDTNPTINSDGEGTEIDDCDFEGLTFVGSWNDAQNAPSSIVFHTTDDDGEMVYAEIPIVVNNVKPSAHAMIDNANPTEGDAVYLSANLTTDSTFDLENMLYVWDLDTSSDSDGDGIKDNDEDATGIWFEWHFDSPGKRTVKMTASDEDTSDSFTFTVSVVEKPFSFGELLGGGEMILILIVVIASLGGILVMRLRKPSDLVEAPVGARVSRISMDDAFDDVDYDPFSDDEEKRKVRKTGNDENKVINNETTDDNDPQRKEEPVMEEAPTIQMTELDHQYEKASEPKQDLDEALGDLLGDESDSSEEE